MRFKLTTSGHFYTEASAEPLRKLGFKFDSYRGGSKLEKIQDSEIEIDSLEALMDFVSDWGEIVLTDDTIEICDYYRE